MSRKNQSNRLKQYIQELMGDSDSSSEEISIGSFSNTNQAQPPIMSSSTTSKDSSNYVSLAPIESTELLFDDLVNFSNQSNEHYQKTFETLQEFDKMAIDLAWNIDTYRKEDENQQQQQILLSSQPKQSTAATATTTTDNNTNLIKEIQVDIEKIPVYLTKHNPSFRQMVHNIHLTIKTTSSIVIDQTNNKECIRKIGLLIYKIMIIQIYHYLWSTYLKSGLGQLITTTHKQQVSYHTNIPIWPKELKVLLLVTVKSQIKNIDNQHYLNFVREQLHLLDSELNIYRNQLNILANHFHGYTLQIQTMIKSYIEEHYHSFRMKIVHRIELLHYDYHIRALKLEYIRHRPNQFQEQLLKELCQTKYEHATSEQEYQFIRKQIDRHKNSFNRTYENSSLAQTVGVLINSDPPIDNPQQLFQQFKTIVEESRNDILQLHSNVLEEERKISRTKYEESLKKMWSVYRHPKDSIQTISSDMAQIIIERCAKIGERIDCIYKFKAQSNLS